MIRFVSPAALRVGRDITDYLERHQVDYSEGEVLDDVLAETDVLYATRIQQERFGDPSEYERCKGCYQIGAAVVDRMRDRAVIMHPLPRVDEILPEVDASPRAAYFRQARYALLVRMALLKTILQ